MRKYGIYIFAALLLVGIGFGLGELRHRRSIAGYDAREQENQAKLKANAAAQDQLRGENKVIRDENEKIRTEIAELSASEEALKQIIAENGGRVAVEGQKLEQINEQLKTKEAVVSAPTDRCTRCRSFSADALHNGTIRKPLSCADECAGTNR